jgi:hypothetical protein
MLHEGFKLSASNLRSIDVALSTPQVHHPIGLLEVAAVVQQVPRGTEKTH